MSYVSRALSGRRIVYWGIVIALAVLGAGCVTATFETTDTVAVDTSRPKVGKTVAVGLIVDNRFPFWPRRETNPPMVKEEEKELIKDFEPLPVSKEVRIPMGEIRSHLAQTLKLSGRFDEIINPPTSLVGDTLPAMLQKALETSDYLVVGELNAFHTKNLGLNRVTYFTLPFDISIFALPNCVVLTLTGGKSLLLTGGVFPAYSGETILSMSITVYSVETGHALTTFRIEERARSPVDNITIYGDLSNPEDDWIDFGRRLGEVALANACANAVGKIADAVHKDGLKKEGR